MPRIALSFVLAAFFSIGLHGQVNHPIPPKGSATINVSVPPAPKDPQAVSFLNQALTAAGGASAIQAIKDYTATGSISVYGRSAAQGTVTLQALKLNQFRRDTSLPSGTSSWAVTDGQANTRAEDGTVRPLSSQVPMSASGFVLPARYFSAALNFTQLRVSYQGLVQVDGHSVQDVRVQRPFLMEVPEASRVMPGRTIDFFIDASTFQVVMAQELISRGVLHQIHYSDYQLVNRILVPFAIREDYSGNPSCLIQLNQITFNTGLQDSLFQF